MCARTHSGTHRHVVQHFYFFVSFHVWAEVIVVLELLPHLCIYMCTCARMGLTPLLVWLFACASLGTCMWVSFTKLSCSPTPDCLHLTCWNAALCFCLTPVHVFVCIYIAVRASQCAAVQAATWLKWLKIKYQTPNGHRHTHTHIHQSEAEGGVGGDKWE